MTLLNNIILKMSFIYYFFIGNKTNKSTICSIFESTLGATIQDVNEIKFKADRYFSEITEIDTQNIDNEFQKYKAYYTLTNNNYFYYIVVPKEYTEDLNIEIIFNLIKEINDNEIPKQIDTNGSLSQSGIQNLKLIISKYTEKKDESENTNTEKVETISDIIKENPDVINLGKGGEKDNLKKINHRELKEEVSLDDINKDINPIDIAQNENEHPYQKMHEIINKKIRLTKIAVYSISILIGLIITFRIISYGKYFSE